MLLRLCAALAFFTACIDDTSTDTQASTDPTADHHGPPPPAEAFDGGRDLRV